MYAVIESGGKQHRVIEGETLKLEKIEAATGETIEFDFSATGLGSGTGILIGAQASGSGQIGEPLSFGAFVFEGTVFGALMRGTFDFPTGGAGTASLSHTVAIEDNSFGQLKSSFDAPR